MARRGRPSLNLSIEEKRDRRRSQFVNSQRKARARKRLSGQQCPDENSAIMEGYTSASPTPTPTSYLESDSFCDFDAATILSLDYDATHGGTNMPFATLRQIEETSGTASSPVSGTLTDTAAELGAVSDLSPASITKPPSGLPRTDTYARKYRSEPRDEPNTLFEPYVNELELSNPNDLPSAPGNSQLYIENSLWGDGFIPEASWDAREQLNPCTNSESLLPDDDKLYYSTPLGCSPVSSTLTDSASASHLSINHDSLQFLGSSGSLHLSHHCHWPTTYDYRCCQNVQEVPSSMHMSSHHQHRNGERITAGSLSTSYQMDPIFSITPFAMNQVMIIPGSWNSSRALMGFVSMPRGEMESLDGSFVSSYSSPYSQGLMAGH